jgi:hypothetical protein
MGDGAAGVRPRLRLVHPVPRLARHARDLEVVPWQALELAEVGLTEEQVRAAAYWLDGQVVDSGGPIAARWSHAGPDTPCWDACCCSRGGRRVAASGYRLVARHRGRA